MFFSGGLGSDICWFCWCFLRGVVEMGVFFGGDFVVRTWWIECLTWWLRDMFSEGLRFSTFCNFIFLGEMGFVCRSPTTKWKLANYQMKVDALRAAQMELLDKGVPPYYWASGPASKLSETRTGQSDQGDQTERQKAQAAGSLRSGYFTSGLTTIRPEMKNKPEVNGYDRIPSCLPTIRKLRSIQCVTTPQRRVSIRKAR